MKTTLSWIDKHGEAAVIGTMVAAMSILMMMQVILRYIFHNSISWVEEVVVYLHIWCGFIGIAWCVRHDKDMRIDISGIIPAGVAKALRWISDILLMFFYAYMAKAGITVTKQMIDSAQLSPAAHIPMFLVYSAFMCGFFLAMFRFAQKVFLLIRDRKKGGAAS